MRNWSRNTLLLLVLAALPVMAADREARSDVVTATVHARGGWLCADVQLSDLLDHRTISTIESGLSGVCVYEVAITSAAGRPVGRRTWTLQLDHDLWEDVYNVRGPDGEQSVTSIAAMDSLCSRIENLRLLPLGQLDPGNEYRLSVSVEVLPLGAAAQDRLSQYISRRGSSNREELDLDLGSLFARVFSGGRAGRTTLAYTGPEFRPGTLERQP